MADFVQSGAAGFARPSQGNEAVNVGFLASRIRECQNPSLSPANPVYFLNFRL